MSNMTTSDVLDELSSPKVQVNMTSDERYTRFVGDIRDSVRIELTVYTVCFVIGATCNLRALYKLSQKANKNRVNYLIRHLVLADLMVAFFAIFPEIIWRISVTWNAGVVLCKLLNTVKAFTLYLSSNIIVCISLDRFYAFVKPFSHMNFMHRNNLFLSGAYSISLLLSIPQAFIFHVKYHPEIPRFSQCTAADYFENKWLERSYNIGSVFGMYFIPLIIIISCYTAIVIKVSGNFNAAEPSDSASSSRTSTMVRARRNTLKMTISIVVTFILCWSPYAIMVFWYQLHRQSAEHISGWITSAFFIFAFSSSCVNPLLHSWHLLVAPCSCSRTVQSHRNGLQPKMSRRLNSATLVTQV